MKKTAQQIQDEIFRKMSVERKIRMASSFWNFAKTMAGDRIYYNINRGTVFLRKIDGFREYIKKSR